MKKIVIGITLTGMLMAYTLLIADGAKQIRDDVRPLVLADGTNPAPLCWPDKPCGVEVNAIAASRINVKQSDQGVLVLADGTGPAPLCWPSQPCGPVSVIAK